MWPNSEHAFNQAIIPYRLHNLLGLENGDTCPDVEWKRITGAGSLFASSKDINQHPLTNLIFQVGGDS